MALLLLNESKRDNLLLPYYEIVKSKRPELSFGEFKSNLLEHLTQNGGLRNLSLASNYYLAGAARYYFNGDLTDNKDLALLYPYTSNARLEMAVNNGEHIVPNHKDIWKKEICVSLNKIILLLRNSYIDTMGETFEQPEDFGALSLPKLLRKYNSKINKLKDNSDEEDETPSLNLSPRVSDNYSFEIMYSHEDCKKFYEATSPGAWCITYGQGHYDYYVKNLNIHYVIFKRDGWENVKREPQKEKWVDGETSYPKPQDDYGNSLIALLQSNKDWRPIYITSRWNHGAGDCGTVEADHAYTTEEFMNITGVDREQLQRIYDIWAKYSIKKEMSASELKESLKGVIRKLKEFQMRINGGANFADYAQKFSIGIAYSFAEKSESGAFSSEQFKKSASIMTIEDSTGVYYFIMDKYRIIFDSVVPMSELVRMRNTHMQGFILPEDWEMRSVKLNDCIVIATSKYYMIYNIRIHNFVNVNGEFKFKKVPLPENSGSWFYGNRDTEFFEVKKGKFDIALINKNTLKPLALPNGEYWFNEVIGGRPNHYERGNKVFAHFIGNNSYPVFQIIYDISSKETYFYNMLLKQFFTPKNDFDFLPTAYSDETLKRHELVPRITTSIYTNSNDDFKYFGCYYSYDLDSSWYYTGDRTPFKFLNAKTYEEVSVFGLNYFDSMFNVSDETENNKCGLFRLNVKDTLKAFRQKDNDALYKLNFFKSKYFNTNIGYIENSYANYYILYDAYSNEPLVINGNLVTVDGGSEAKNILCIKLASSSPIINPKYRKQFDCYVLYDLNKKMFIKNESGFPSHKYFIFAYMSSYFDNNAKEIGWYFPTPESYNDGYYTENMIKINDWHEINEGCVRLEYGNYEYFPNEYYDWQEEFEQFKLNHPLENSEESNLQESIKFMTESVIKNLLNEKRVTN